MKKFTLSGAAALLTCFALYQPATAQEYSPNRWTETQRLNAGDEPVHYADTVYANTTDRQVIDVVIGGYAYKGTVNQDSLNIGSRTFHVVKNEEGEMRLKYGKLTHVFTRAPKGTEGADAQAFAEANKIPDQPLAKLNLKQLYGTWLVYKKSLRQQADADVKNIPYFRKLELFKPGGRQKGYLVLASNVAWKVTGIRGGNISLQTSLGQPATVKVLRQTATELLLEDEHKVVYFLKKHN